VPVGIAVRRMAKDRAAVQEREELARKEAEESIAYGNGKGKSAMSLIGHHLAHVHSAAKQGASDHAGALAGTVALLLLAGVAAEWRRRRGGEGGFSGGSGLGLGLDDMDLDLDIVGGVKREMVGVNSVSFLGLSDLEE